MCGCECGFLHVPVFVCVRQCVCVPVRVPVWANVCACVAVYVCGVVVCVHACE